VGVTTGLPKEQSARDSVYDFVKSLRSNNIFARNIEVILRVLLVPRPVF